MVTCLQSFGGLDRGLAGFLDTRIELGMLQLEMLLQL
jgi:hypothetical protein